MVAGFSQGSKGTSCFFYFLRFPHFYIYDLCIWPFHPKATGAPTYTPWITAVSIYSTKLGWRVRTTSRIPWWVYRWWTADVFRWRTSLPRRWTSELVVRRSSSSWRLYFQRQQQQYRTAPALGSTLKAILNRLLQEILQQRGMADYVEQIEATSGRTIKNCQVSCVPR